MKSDVAVALGAIAIALVQLALFVGAAEGRSWSDRYRSAFQWDSRWYADIARRGYVTTIPPVPVGEVSNVTHFPGYPLAIRAVTRVLGFDDRASALLTAQLCTCAFWVYVLLLFRRWRVARLDQILGVVFIVTHPMAFFMVAAYSEPMFLMTVVGFWYWFVRGTPATLGLGALHGMAACATRVAGAGCVISPLVDVLAGRRTHQPQLARVAGACAVTGVSLLGVVLFLAFCYERFGIWNIYAIRQTIGWGHRFDAWAFFYPSAYRFFLPDWHDETSLGVFLNPFTLAAVIGLLALSFRPGADREGRHFALSSLAILYLTVASLYHTHFPAMARYQFQVHVLLVIGYLHALASEAAASSRACSPAATSVVTRIAISVLGIAAGILVWKSVGLQFYFASVFSRGGPVL